MGEQVVGGLVVRKTPYLSDAEIITLLTPQGWLGVFAPGVRKMASKNAYALQLGNIVTVEIFRARLTNKLARLKRATLRLQPPLFVADTANVVLVILRHLQTLSQSSPALWRAVNDAFAYFGPDYNHHVKTYVFFHSLSALGTQVVTNRCVVCGRHDRISGFDWSVGGLTCAWHTKHPRDRAYLEAITALAGPVQPYLATPVALNQELFAELSAYLNATGWA